MIGILIIYLTYIYFYHPMSKVTIVSKNRPEEKNHNPKAPDFRSLSISSPVFFTVI